MDSASRTDVPAIGDERTLLTAFLDYQRDTLEWKCSELSDAQLRARVVEPSGLSLLGLVRHMTEVERGWFQECVGGERLEPRFVFGPDWNATFDDLDSHGSAEVFDMWRAACEQSRRIAAALPLEHEGIAGRSREPVSLRWVLIHMVEEYARHNGHADLIRERIDGAVGM